jgi:hypothetical protein
MPEIKLIYRPMMAASTTLIPIEQTNHRVVSSFLARSLLNYLSNPYVLQTDAIIKAMAILLLRIDKASAIVL